MGLSSDWYRVDGIYGILFQEFILTNWTLGECRINGLEWTQPRRVLTRADVSPLAANRRTAALAKKFHELCPVPSAWETNLFCLFAAYCCD